MKIKQYQFGGILYTPKFSKTDHQFKGTSIDTKSGDNTIMKEIVSVLKENGLQNDVDTFLSYANRLLAKPYGGLFNDTSYDTSDMIKLISLANKVRLNNTAYTTAKDRIKTQNAGSDVALTTDGNIYVYTEDGLKTVDPYTYYNNRDSYKALTNYDILNLRENADSLSFRGDILNDLTNTISMSSIVDHLKSIINSFGTVTTSEDLGKSSKVSKGMRYLKDRSSRELISQLRKVKKTDQGYDVDTLDGFPEAINYLYNTLDTNMKHVLRAVVAAEGEDPNEVENIYSLIIQATNEHTNHSRVYDTDSSKSGNGSGSGSSGSLIALDSGTMYQNEMGNPVKHDIILTAGNVKFKLPAYDYNILKGLDNKEVPNVTSYGDTVRILRNRGIVNTHGKAYFGEIELSNMDWNSILIDNSKGSRVVYAPVDKYGNLNFDLMIQMTKIQEEIENRRLLDPLQRQQLWESYGFEYDNDLGIGKPMNYQLKPFFTQSAYSSEASSSSLDGKLKGSQLLSVVDDNVIESLQSTVNKETDSAIDLNPSLWWSKSYEGLIFIPLNQNQLEVRFANNNAYETKENVWVKAAEKQFIEKNNPTGQQIISNSDALN